MSQQFDIIAGKDISAVASVVQEDMMQMVNQLEPLDNIGLIVAGTERPDITNNPRFIRYIWLDITTPTNPIFKRYIGDRTVLQDADIYWATLGVAELTVLTSMMAARSAAGGVHVDLLKLNADYSATPASAYYILRVSANGKNIEAIAINNAIVDAGGLDLSSIDTTGLAAGKFLGFNGGVAGYVIIVPSVDLIGASRIALETNVVPGTARYIARTNAAGTAGEWVTPDGLFSDSELTVQRLLAAGAVVNDILRFDGSIWAKATPSLRLAAGDVANAGILSGFTIATSVHTIPHLLGAIPKLVQVRLRLTGAGELGYSTNDEVDISGYKSGGAAVAAAYCMDATNITILSNAVTGNLPNKTTGVDAAITEASWTPVVYAWR